MPRVRSYMIPKIPQFITSCRDEVHMLKVLRRRETLLKNPQKALNITNAHLKRNDS